MKLLTFWAFANIFRYKLGKTVNQHETFDLFQTFNQQETFDLLVELVSKELNHLEAILHVYVGGLKFKKILLHF